MSRAIVIDNDSREENCLIFDKDISEEIAMATRFDPWWSFM